MDDNDKTELFPEPDNSEDSGLSANPEACECAEEPETGESLCKSSEADAALSGTAPSDAVTAGPEPQNGKPDSAKKIISNIFDYVELVAWSVFAVLIIFTFAFRTCQVDGQSMENTLHDRERLLLYSFAYTPKQDDIVVFHLTKPDVNLQKTLVKRVIATGGQEIEIDTNLGTVRIDGELYEDSHSVLKDSSDREIGFYYSGLFGYGYDYKTGIFKATVPEGRLFVMGDNRNNSKDSRNPDVGFVDENCILGKVVLRMSPFTVFR